MAPAAVTDGRGPGRGAYASAMALITETRRDPYRHPASRPAAAAGTPDAGAGPDPITGAAGPGSGRGGRARRRP